MDFDFSFSSLMAGFVFGVFGVYFIKEGKRRGLAPWVIIGLLLCVYPYFITNDWLVWIVGGGLIFVATRF